MISLINELRKKLNELEERILEMESNKKFPPCCAPIQLLQYVDLSSGSNVDKMRRIVEQIQEYNINILATPKDSNIVRSTLVAELGVNGLKYWLRIRKFREDYDEQLQSETLSQEEQEKIMQENYELKQRINKIGQQQATQQTAYNQYQQQSQQQQNVDEGTIVNMSRVLTEQIRAAQRQAYYDAYIQDMKSRGYKIRYKRGFKYYLKLIKVILIMLVICFLVYQLPPVKGYFHNLYNENMIFQAIVNIFRNTFSVKF